MMKAISRTLVLLFALGLGLSNLVAGKGQPGEPVTPVFTFLYYEGEVVRTVVPPAAMKKMGRDNLYAFPNGEQMPIAAVAPGDKNYHGGQWAFHTVTWNTEPYDLKSEYEVSMAAASGDVTVTRVYENDFKCPIQP